MSFLEKVRSLCHDFVICRCDEWGCQLDTRAIDCVILDGDRFLGNKASCDCFVFAVQDELVVVVHVELKSKSLRAEKIREKMVSSDKASQSILRAIGFDSWDRCRYLYIVLHKGIRTPEFKSLTGRNLKLRGEKHHLHAFHCGTKLKDVTARLLVL